MQLLKTVTSSGTRFYIDGKRVSRDSFLAAKSGPNKRLDCFITRATKNAVRDWVSVTVTN